MNQRGLVKPFSVVEYKDFSDWLATLNRPFYRIGYLDGIKYHWKDNVDAFAFDMENGKVQVDKLVVDQIVKHL